MKRIRWSPTHKSLTECGRRLDSRRATAVGGVDSDRYHHPVHGPRRESNPGMGICASEAGYQPISRPTHWLAVGGPYSMGSTLPLERHTKLTSFMASADRLIIAEVRVGHPLRIRTEFELTTSSNPDFVGLERLGKDVLVVVSRAMSDTLPKSHVDDFQQLTSCGLEGHASLTLLTGEKFSKIWEKQLADINFAKTFSARDGSVRLVGSTRPGCG